MDPRIILGRGDGEWRLCTGGERTSRLERLGGDPLRRLEEGEGELRRFGAGDGDPLLLGGGDGVYLL